MSAPGGLPRTTSRTAVFTLVLVFLGGAATGAVLMRLREHQVHAPATASGFASTVADWQKQLDLTDAQTRQINTILDNFSQNYGNVLADGNSQIQQVLTGEQKQRFEALLRAHRH